MSNAAASNQANGSGRLPREATAITSLGVWKHRNTLQKAWPNDKLVPHQNFSLTYQALVIMTFSVMQASLVRTIEAS